MNKWRACARVLLPFLLAAPLACGGEPAAGPVEPAWDRDTCEHCRMTLSDRRFAAQIRLDHDGHVRLFDDLGCALTWLEEVQGAGHEAREFFVRDMEDEGWLRAGQAHYRTDRLTPMGYGFGAISAGEAGAITLDQVIKAVRERADGRHASE